MPAAKLTPAIWQEVKSASEAGCSDEELGEIYGVSRPAIRQRKKRENWLTPRKLHEMAAVEEATSKARLSARMHEPGVTVVTGPSGLGVASAKLAKLREETPLLIAEKVADLIKQSFEMGAIKAPSDWTELASANKIFRSNAGLDAEKGGGVTLNVGMSWTGSGQNRGCPTILAADERPVN